MSNRKEELFNKLSAVIAEFVYHEDNDEEISFHLIFQLMIAVSNYYLFLRNGEQEV